MTRLSSPEDVALAGELSAWALVPGPKCSVDVEVASCVFSGFEAPLEVGVFTMAAVTGVTLELSEAVLGPMDWALAWVVETCIVGWDAAVAWLVVDDKIVGCTCTLVDEDVVRLDSGGRITSAVDCTEEVLSVWVEVVVGCVFVSEVATAGWTENVGGWTTEKVWLCTAIVDVVVSVTDVVSDTVVDEVEVEVEVEVIVLVTTVANMLAAAACASPICLSETGFSSSLHPV